MQDSEPLSTVSEVVSAVVSEWKREYGHNPRAINNGECMAFVDDVFRVKPDGIEMYRMDTEHPDALGPSENPDYKQEPYHVWVTDGEMHYDSEAVSGVSEWWELPFFKRTLGW